VTLSPITLAVLGGLCALVGSVGGIGGATLLVPLLLVLGMEPLQAAPLGLLAVAAGSLAAASRQVDDGLVHHRLGLTVELTAGMGTVAGALLSTQVPEVWLARLLGVAALVGAGAARGRSGSRNLPHSTFDAEPGGEWPGTLGGQYPLGGRMVPYQARRVPAGLVASVLAGAVAGLSGVGGGFVKTPAMSEIMRVPVKVAGATTTFTLGLTASTGLLIYAVQGRIEVRGGAAVVAGAVAGGLIGARVQSALPATAVRRLTGVLLVLVAAIVLGGSV
jgi:uncharacterized membrane protein YfcA